jgi:hypothetical protein
LAGTAPVTRQSGNFCKAYQQFAWQSTKYETWAANSYARNRAEGKTHSVALRTLANQWVRIIFAVWHKHTVYDGAIFQAARQAHAPRAA